MPNMNDMARMMAAGEGTGMEGGPAGEPGMVESVGQEGGDPLAEMAGAIDAIEAASGGLPPEVQEKIRQHVEGLRGCLEEAGASAAPAEEGAGPAGESAPPMAGLGDLGMMS